MTTVDLAALGIDDFRPHLGSQFDLQAASGTVAMKLSRVDPAGESGRKGGAFSLIFGAPRGPWLPQAIYPVSHPALGAMEIFLVPVGPLEGGNGYQAVFT
ncbi:MAG TPA: hypothetical protein VGH70_15050 [Bradyrhizobium sp.]